MADGGEGVTPPHPNAMIHWDAIRCQRGCDGHNMTLTNVKLGGHHGYGDYPLVPARLARSFEMFVYDPNVHPVDNGPYCPARDAVSETIISHRIWEPRETILAADTFVRSAASPWFVDFGSQVGWFSLLAASFGLDVLAIEADEDNRAMVSRSFGINGWADQLHLMGCRVGPDTPALDAETLNHENICLAKLDIEGAEHDAIAMLWPAIEAGQVERLLIEVSPVFRDGYGELVAKLVGTGYRAYTLPPKRRPPYDMEYPTEALAPFRIDNRPISDLVSLVDSWHQEDIWLVHEGVE